MRLIVARCEVTYTGRLNAFLPESTRLLMLKEDGPFSSTRTREGTSFEQDEVGFPTPLVA